MIDAALQPLKQWFDGLDPQSFAYQNLLGVDRWLTDWVPVRTGFTDIGTPTITTRIRQVGRKVEGQVRIVPATSIATSAGTSYIGCPIAAEGLGGMVTMFNATTMVAVGSGGIDVANSRIHLPSQVANGSTFVISFWYEV